MTARLQQALEALYGLERRKDKLDLEGTRALLRALGDPHLRFRSMHVAGTNGKGSTCAILERVLRAAGFRTGLFTSPHLVDFRERIRVSGRWADEAWLERRLDFLNGLPEGKGRTFFEVCTALAFDYFASQGVEWAVVEVGLGGRLDCTNVLSPDVCVITSIGFDHTEILGSSIEMIAAEKAGILKPGVPVVVGSRMEPSARAVIARLAAERGSEVLTPLETLERDLERAQNPTLLRLNGPTAMAALEALRARVVPIPPPAIEYGVRLARWPGRLESAPHEPRLWWDGAHNVEGARALAESWSGEPFAALVLATSGDKDVHGMLDSLGPIVAPRRLVATRTRSPRARSGDEIATAAAALGWSAETAPDVAAACHRALALAGEPPVLLTGSLFAVGEAMESFGGAPGEWL